MLIYIAILYIGYVLFVDKPYRMKKKRLSTKNLDDLSYFINRK